MLDKTNLGEAAHVGEELLEESSLTSLHRTFLVAVDTIIDGDFTTEGAYDIYMKQHEPKTPNSRIAELQKSWEFIGGCKVLIERKPLNLSLLKMAEELNELSTKILQKLNNPDKVNHADIMEELVDVQMHLLIFEEIYNDVNINKDTVRTKISKMINSEDFKKYANQPKT